MFKKLMKSIDELLDAFKQIENMGYCVVCDEFRVRNYEGLCRDCYDKCEMCEMCEEWYDVDDMTVAKDMLVCADCLSDEFIRCDNCGEWEFYDDVVEYDEMELCDDCMNELFDVEEAIDRLMVYEREEPFTLEENIKWLNRIENYDVGCPCNEFECPKAIGKRQCGRCKRSELWVLISDYGARGKIKELMESELLDLINSQFIEEMIR